MDLLAASIKPFFVMMNEVPIASEEVMASARPIYFSSTIVDRVIYNSHSVNSAHNSLQIRFITRASSDSALLSCNQSEINSTHREAEIDEKLKNETLQLEILTLLIQSSCYSSLQERESRNLNRIGMKHKKIEKFQKWCGTIEFQLLLQTTTNLIKSTEFSLVEQPRLEITT